jgi:hypothetical protein
MFKVFAPIIIISIIYCIGYSIYYNYKHPCVAYRDYKCSYNECVLEMPVTTGDVTVMQCFAWETVEDICHECTARKP